MTAASRRCSPQLPTLDYLQTPHRRFLIHGVVFADNKETLRFIGAVGPGAQNAQLTPFVQFPLAWSSGVELARLLL